MSGEPAVRSNEVNTWHVVSRWLEYEGEARANALRLIAIGVFYLIELINYHGLQLGFIDLPRVADSRFHGAMTSLAVGWTAVGLAVLYCQTHRFFPPLLTYVSVVLDVVLMTLVLIVADGPRSPMVVGYFLIIALSGLRFRLGLVRATTISAIAGYVILLGYARWYATDTRVPRYHQLIMCVALALAGIVAGQIIRRVRDVAEDYAARRDSAGESDG